MLIRLDAGRTAGQPFAYEGDSLLPVIIGALSCPGLQRYSRQWWNMGCSRLLVEGLLPGPGRPPCWRNGPPPSRKHLLLGCHFDVRSSLDSRSGYSGDWDHELLLGIFSPVGSFCQSLVAG